MACLLKVRAFLAGAGRPSSSSSLRARWQRRSARAKARAPLLGCAASRYVPHLQAMALAAAGPECKQHLQLEQRRRRRPAVPLTRPQPSPFAPYASVPLHQPLQPVLAAGGGPAPEFWPITSSSPSPCSSPCPASQNPGSQNPMALARASHQEEELAQLSVFTDALPSPSVCALHHDIVSNRMRQPEQQGTMVRTYARRPVSHASVVADTIVVHVSLPWVANSSKSSLEPYCPLSSLMNFVHAALCISSV